VGFYVRSFVAVVRYERGIVEDNEEDIGRHMVGQLARQLYIYNVNIAQRHHTAITRQYCRSVGPVV